MDCHGTDNILNWHTYGSSPTKIVRTARVRQLIRNYTRNGSLRLTNRNEHALPSDIVRRRIHSSHYKSLWTTFSSCFYFKCPPLSDQPCPQYCPISIRVVFVLSLPGFAMAHVWGHEFKNLGDTSTSKRRSGCFRPPQWLTQIFVWPRDLENLNSSSYNLGILFCQNQPTCSRVIAIRN